MNNELVEQIQKLDPQFWNRKLNFAYSKIENYKRLNNKAPFFIDLYTIYLQLTEIFLLNIFALLENNWSTIFISNSDIRKKISDYFYYKKKIKNEFILELLENYIIGKKEWIDVKNRDEKFRLYSKYLKEIIKDYTQDHDLLNAYKHGYRIKSSGENSISIARSGSNQAFQLDKYTASISYYSKEGKEIVENNLSFKHPRIYIKTLFLINMIENIKEIVTAIDEEKPVKKLNYLVETDKAINAQSFGCSRFKETKFTITKVNKKK